MGNVARMAGACSQHGHFRAAHLVVESGAPPSKATISGPMAWFALVIHQYKREQCELMLAHLDYEFFSPCTSVVREWSDRQKRGLVPLFPGYIFCRLNPEDRVALLQIPGVLGIVGSGKCFLEVDPHEIEAVRVALASRLPLEPHPEVVPGKKVKVVDGPLRGLEGQLVRVKAQARLLLSVSMLNRAVSVEVEAHQLAVQN